MTKYDLKPIKILKNMHIGTDINIHFKLIKYASAVLYTFETEHRIYTNITNE